MADEATQEVEQTSSAENTAAESQTVEQTTDTQTSNEAGDQGSQTDSGKADQTASTDVKKPSETQDAKQESKPLSRRSAAYRIQQLTRENKQLREQQQKPKQEQNEWEEEPQVNAQSNPEIEALKTELAELKGMVQPVYTESAKAADDAEIKELFSGERAADKDQYEPKIREMWGLDQYKNVAAADLYKIAKFDELQASIPAIQQKAIGDYKQAEREAKDASASGTNNTSNRTGKGKSIADMSDEELLAHNDRVKAGKA